MSEDFNEVRRWLALSTNNKPEPLEALARIESQLASLQKQLEDARPILEYVSRGRGFVGVEPYPDATARRVLGEMTDA